MSIKYRIIRGVIAWINRADPYILRELVVPEGSHIQRNGKRPRKKKSPVTGE
jgi:hypothetical protein